MLSLEKWLLRATVFLIPTNLAYHVVVPAAYVAGHLVDYRLPRLYLSDLPILMLLVLWFASPRFTQSLKRYRQVYLVVAIFMATSAVNAVYQSGSLASALPSLWLIAKLVQLFLFLMCISGRFKATRLARIIIPPAMLSIVFQLTIAIYQYIRQSSVIGYLLLGEPNLVQSPNISTAFVNQSLKLLSYGTTAHPNVLAGFFVIVTGWLKVFTKHNPKNQAINYLFLFSIMSTTIIIYMTRSLTALFGLSLLLTWDRFRLPKISTNVLWVLSLIIWLITASLPLIFHTVPYHSPSALITSSIDRRYKLISYSFQLIKTQPFTGVGLNNYLPALMDAHFTTTLPFFQPVHNALILWITETGFLANLVLLWLGFKALKASKIGFHPGSLPLLFAYIPLSALDHYLVTLQTGQLLLVLSLALVMKPANRS